MIEVTNVSKTFHIPHERKLTLREHILGFLRGGGTASFEPLRALQEVSFEVHKGEFFSIIGKNGSGKSTLLKILANIYAPDSGGCKVYGTLSPFLELGIGFNPDLTARDNVFLSAAVMGLSRKEIEELYDDIIRFSELERFQDQKFKNFSSGMKVRLAFSVAFMVNAEILLIDEVLAVGDASFKEKCYDVFRRLKGEGKTIIFVSHGMADVREFSDRVMLMHHGKVMSLGAPDKVIYDYQLLTAREDEARFAVETRQQKKKEVASFSFSVTSETRWGDDRMSVTQVRFVDEKRREKHVYATGEPLCMEVEFQKNHASVEVAKVSATICRSDDINVFGTVSDPMDIRRMGTGEKRCVQLHFSRLELLSGIYYFDIALTPEDKKAEPYDFLKKAGKIRVYQDERGFYRKSLGICHLGHEWKMGIAETL